MDYRNTKNKDSWDEGVYGTGSTMPPKSHEGLIALLLILVIFLSGIISVLSFLNIRLFQQLSLERTREEPEIPLMVFDAGPTQAQSDHLAQSPESVRAEGSIVLHSAPPSPEELPEPGEDAIQYIYARNRESVLAVSCSTPEGNPQGAAVAISHDGYLLTDWSLVAEAETISVQLPDGAACSALVVGADPATDLAVLYADGAALTPAQFGDSAALRVGDRVYAIGSSPAAGPGSTVSPGIVTELHREVPLSDHTAGLIRSNALLSENCTGAPLVNCYGQIVGIHTAGAGFLLRDGDTKGTHFALDSVTVRDIVNQLIAQGYVSGRPTLGIRGEGVSLFDQYYFHIPPGLYIREVDPLSDARILGIEPGDILISVSGTPITSQRQLDELVAKCRIGDSLEVTFLRNSQEQTLVLTLTEYTG